MTIRYCFALDLKDNPKLIEEYRLYHKNVWPEVVQSFRDAGIESLEIYLLGTRMFMILEGNEHFSLASKASADLANPKIQEWEALMWGFQQALPQAGPGEKWLVMEQIYHFHQG